MDRWKQYVGLGGLFVSCFAVGLWGFTAIGGALPYAKRFTKVLQHGSQEGGGSLVALGRGIVIAGPIRKGGLVGEFGLIIGLFAIIGIGLYVYVDRYCGLDGRDRAV